MLNAEVTNKNIINLILILNLRKSKDFETKISTKTMSVFSKSL